MSEIAPHINLDRLLKKYGEQRPDADEVLERVLAELQARGVDMNGQLVEDVGVLWMLAVSNLGD